MRWITKKEKNETKWRKWFAWYPVEERIDSRLLDSSQVSVSIWYWLRYVERCDYWVGGGPDSYGWSYKYRELKKSL